MQQNAYVHTDRFISFDEYIEKKYASELKSILLEDVLNSYDGSARVSLDKHTGKIESIRYWQDSATEVSGLISYSAECRIDYEGRVDFCICECTLGLNVSIIQDRIDCDFYIIHENIHTLKRYRPNDRLDRYLLPIAGTQRIEDICNGILRHYCHDAIVKNQIIAPMELANALGLKIMRLPLCDMDSKRSLLITEDTELPVCHTYDKRNGAHILVECNTIVINKNYSYYRSGESAGIAHECYHFAGQKLFNQLQSISRREFPSLGNRKLEHNADEADTYDWLEWQAYIGASFLRYPGCYARMEVPDELDRFAADSKHDGEKYTYAIRSIANRRGLPTSTVCKVLRYQKHIAAKGACNYVDGSYLKSFAFDTSKCVGSYTFVIRFEEVLRLYVENNKLRQALKKGVFVYVDGHLCANTPEYVRLSEGQGYELTYTALAHIDRCCLRFYIDFSRNKQPGFQFGILSCDDEELSYKSKLADVCGCESGLIETTFKAYEFIHNLPIRFGDTLKFYREKAGMTQYALADEAELDEKTVRRIESGETLQISLSVALRLAHGLQLESMYLSDFLRRANYIPDDSPAGRSLECIMFHFNVLNIETLKAAAEEYESIRHASTAKEAIQISAKKAHNFAPAKDKAHKTAV